MSFLFPAYLLGFLGLALPWILHRFSDQQAPERDFPSRTFLEATTPPVSRRKSLRYKTLLALRIAALALLCTLFAEPWINRINSAQSGQQHHIIAIDSSLSMRARGRWDEGLSQAGKLLDDFGPAQSYDVLTFSQDITVVASSDLESSDTQLAQRNVLGTLSPGYASADYGALLQQINRMSVEKEIPVKVTLITDLQKSALPNQLNALYAPNIAQFEVIDVLPEQQSNVHLSAVASSRDGVNAQVRASLLWSLSNEEGNEQGNEQSNEQSMAAEAEQEELAGDKLTRTVQVSMEDSIVASRQVELSVGELLIVNFEALSVPEQGEPLVRVSVLEADDLPDDNEQIVVFDSVDPVSVVLLNGDRSSQGSAPVFLSTALETDTLALVNNIAGAASLVPQDTSHIVTGRDISESVDLDVLQFVDRGNNALVFNTVDTTDSSALGRSALGSSALNLLGSDVGTLDDSHPLGLSSIDWFATQFYALPDIQLTDQDRVLIKTADEQILLVERATERGRLLLLNDPLDGLASNLPLQPSFVELVQAIVNYFDANTSIAVSALVGERITLPPGVQILDNDNQPMLGLGSNTQPSSVELKTPGLYTVVSARGEQSLQVILDPAEADITTMSRASMQAWQGRYDEERSSNPDNALSQSGSAILDDISTTDSERLRQHLWFWLLPLMVLALFLETVFANRHLDVRRDGS